MATASHSTSDDKEPVPASYPSSQHRTRGRRAPARPGELPADIEAAIWRGTELGSPVTEVVSSGFPALPALDAELPGAGWPCTSLTDLQPQPTVLEWRLLASAIREVGAGGGNIVVVGPPKTPHLPSLRHVGLDERHQVWIQADTPAERLWVPVSSRSRMRQASCR
jgi:protein ImuA